MSASPWPPKPRGYFAIGAERASKALNLGNLMRSAHAFGASFTFTIGAQYQALEARADTSKGQWHLPHYDWKSPGDMVLPKISTNVGVWPNEPQADALTWFLDGFSRFRRLPADALILPSHGFPFIGLHTRLDQLVAHHDARLNDMTAAIAHRGAEGATGWDMVPVLFPRHLDNNQVVFAFGETLAHLHCLETRTRAKRVVVDGVHRFVALVDPHAQPPADDSDADVMDVGTA